LAFAKQEALKTTLYFSQK